MAAMRDLVARYIECMNQIEFDKRPFDASRLLQALANLLRLAREIHGAAVLESDHAGAEKADSCLELLVKSSESILELIESHPVNMDAAATEIMSILNELKTAHAGDSICGT